MFEVSDDSGFLALVVPATYSTFVDSDWTLDQILAHFKVEMARHSLLIWGTGLEGIWTVDVVLKNTNVRGFREIKGLLRVEGESLMLTNYESLTMAAQFQDVTMPEKHQQHLVISLPNGDYACRIIQMFDPEGHESAGDGKPDFVVEVRKTRGKTGSWAKIPWSTVDD